MFKRKKHKHISDKERGRKKNVTTKLVANALENDRRSMVTALMAKLGTMDTILTRYLKMRKVRNINFLLIHFKLKECDVLNN